MPDISDRWQRVACPSILSALPLSHGGGFTTVVVVAIGVDNDSTPGTLYHSALQSVRPQHAQPYAHSHTSHTHHNRTHAHPVCYTHTTMAQKAKAQGVAHVYMPPHLPRTPACCAAVPPSYTHRQATQCSQHRVLEPQQRDTAPAVRAAAVDWLRCIHLPGLQPTIHTRDPVLWQRSTRRVAERLC